MPRIRLFSPGRRRPGKVVVLVALSLTGTIGVVAIALDGGLLQDDQHRLQAAADAAALSAATDLYKNYSTNQGVDLSGTAAKSAQTTAAANGFSNGSNGAAVTVNIPPQSGTFIGQAGYAEVIIQYNQNRCFSNIFGSGAIPLSARAVARGTQKPYSNAGAVLLNTSGSGAFNDPGNALTLGGGASIAVNSTNSQAVTLSGNAVVTVSQFNITGNYSIGGSNAILSGSVSTGVPPTPDPLITIPVPDPSTLSVQSNSTVSYSSGIVTLQPGVYNGGMSFSSTAVVTLEPGVYYLNGGGLNVTGMASLTGQGVMIYNNPLSKKDVVNLSGQGVTVLSPPTSGVYAGLTFFQNRSSTLGVTLAGNGNATITGTFYAAAARFTISGNGADIMGSQYVADSLSTTGNGGINIAWSAATVARPRDLRLVE